MPTQSELEASRDKIRAFLEIATAPGASYASQQTALTGIRRELRRVGASKVLAEDLVQISSRTTGDSAYRAAYLVNAATRMADSKDARVPTLLRELDNYRKHVRADTQCAFGMQRLNAAVNSYGPTLGWYSVIDERTTAECREMNGKNFDPREPPAAGLPGVTHVNCRCRPGPPHPELTGAEEIAASLTLVASAPSKPWVYSGSVELSDLNWSPKVNWVEKKGGLPPYVVRIAKHLIAKGFSRSHAIATAINVVKKMHKTGDLNWPGRQNVNAKSRAEASGAVARWEAMKASGTGGNRIEMASPSKQKGRAYGTGGMRVGHLPNPGSTAAPKTQKPGAAPGSIPSPDPKTRSPRGGHIEQTKHGATPKGRTPKRVPVKSSAVKGKGDSDATKAKVRRVKNALANAGWNPNSPGKYGWGPNEDNGGTTKHRHNPPPNPLTIGNLPTKKLKGKQAAKGSDHASPARVNASIEMGMGAGWTRPGAVAKTTNTVMAANVLKKVRAWGKPRKPKVYKTKLPSRI